MVLEAAVQRDHPRVIGIIERIVIDLAKIRKKKKTNERKEINKYQQDSEDLGHVVGYHESTLRFDVLHLILLHNVFFRDAFHSVVKLSSLHANQPNLSKS